MFAILNSGVLCSRYDQISVKVDSGHHCEKCVSFLCDFYILHHVFALADPAPPKTGGITAGFAPLHSISHTTPGMDIRLLKFQLVYPPALPLSSKCTM